MVPQAPQNFEPGPTAALHFGHVAALDHHFRDPGQAREGGPQILECHSPILNLLEQYPIVGRLEQDLFQLLLQTPVRREESRSSGLYECCFYFAV